MSGLLVGGAMGCLIGALLTWREGRRLRRALILALSGLFLALLAWAAKGEILQPFGPDRATYTVTAVVDGDTVDVTKGKTKYRCRLLGLNAGEVKGPFGKQATFWGPEAKVHLAKVLPVGSQVWLVYQKLRKDLYQRDLVWIYRVPDGLFVNLEIVENGFAKPYPHPGDDPARARAIAEAALSAADQRLGIWNAPAVVVPTPVPCPCPEGPPPTGSTLPAITSEDQLPRLWIRVRPCPDGSGTTDGTCPTLTPTPPRPTRGYNERAHKAEQTLRSLIGRGEK